MDNRINSRFSLLAIVMAFSLTGGNTLAQDKKGQPTSGTSFTKKIDLMAYEQFLEDINPFQYDCFKMLQPPTSYFTDVEAHKMRRGKTYTVSVSGKLFGSDRMEFAQNEFNIIDDKGKNLKIRFDPSKFGLNADENGVVRFSLVVPAPSTISTSFVLKQTVEHHFELNVQLEKDGSIKTALFKPILDIERRQHLCAKHRRSLSLSQSGGYHQQDLTSVGGSAVSTALGTAINLLFDYELSESESRLFEMQFGNKTHFLPNTELQREQKNSAFFFGGRYLRQKRKGDLQFELSGAAASPFWRYGLGVEQNEFWNFEKANLATLDKQISLNGLAGFGLDFYSQNRWLLESATMVKVQFLGAGPVQYLVGLEGSAQLLYKHKKMPLASYFGWDGRLNYSFSSYRRSTGMDKKGHVQILEAYAGIVFGQTF